MSGTILGSTQSRDASGPASGMARQLVRILLALGVAYLTRKGVPAEVSGPLTDALAVTIGGAVEVGLAGAGKKLRDKRSPFGVLF